MLKKDFKVTSVVLSSNLVQASKEAMEQLNKLAVFPDPLQVGDVFEILGMKKDAQDANTGRLNPQIFGLVNHEGEEYDENEIRTLSFRAITRKGQGSEGKKPTDIPMPEKLVEKYKDKVLTPIYPLAQGVSIDTFLGRIEGKTLLYAGSEEVEAVYNGNPATVVLQNWCIISDKSED